MKIIKPNKESKPCTTRIKFKCLQIKYNRNKTKRGTNTKYIGDKLTKLKHIMRLNIHEDQKQQMHQMNV